MNDFCYRLHNDGLGDHWASLNLLAHMSMARRALIPYTHSNPSLLARAGLILGLLHLPDHNRVRLEARSDPASEDVAGLNGFDVWATEFFPTQMKWRLRYPRSFICVHFNGISAAEDKNPSLEEQQKILAWAKARKLGVEVLGGEGWPLADVVEQLADCALFVGCDSGFSHIAHSVGCPTYLLEYKLPVVTCHRHKPYVLCKGAEHFKSQADNWLGYMRTLGYLDSTP